MRTRKPYSADRPIESKNQDILGRDKFASQLANDIQRWEGNESLVIGLYGAWGSGKTSVKNLILEANLRQKKNSLSVIDFNPWQLSGTGSIPNVFFKELEIVLNKVGTKPDIEKRSRTLRAYASKISLFAKLAKYLAPLARSLDSGTELEPIATGVEEAASVIQIGGEALKAQVEVDPQSLSDQKGEVRKLLKELQKPILVVIDDIDRLSTEEILQVFQLVKANADFPNLIYLLLFERSIVASALNAISGDRGMEFLEKIVQVGYHLPLASHATVQKVLFSGLDRCIDNSPASKLWDKTRWIDLYSEISEYFKNLRHVYRFLSSFEFHFSHHLSKKSFEVNPIDLIGLEVLRVFEPSVYERLPGAKTILTRSDPLSLYDEIKQPVVDESISQILSEVPHDARPRIKNILITLFPPVTEAYSGRHGVSGDQPQWLRSRRVCHPDYFNKYFTLSIPPDDLSQAELDQLLLLTGQKGRFSVLCGTLQKRGLLNTAFGRLDAYKEQIPLSNMAALTEALCDLGDSFPYRTVGLFEPDLETYAWRLIYFGLKRESNSKRRFEIVRDAISQASGIALPINLVSLDERVGDREQKGHQFLFEESDLSELKDICLKKLRIASNDPQFLQNPRIREFLWRWGDWGGIEEVRAWVATHLKSPEEAVWLLDVLLGEVQISGKDGNTVEYYIQLSVVERFADISNLVQLVSKLDLGKLNSKELRAIKEFNNAIKRRAEGRSDKSWREDSPGENGA